MKKIITSILTLGSLCAFSNDCTIKVKRSYQHNAIFRISTAKKALKEKYIVTNSKSAKYIYSHGFECSYDHTDCRVHISIHKNNDYSSEVQRSYADIFYTEQEDFLAIKTGLIFGTKKKEKQAIIKAISKLESCL
ncbi:MAG: hypothetical protein N4A33_11435 [Bacteriovoracaceae bacterium]|jgi:hypothetical protein|nr:hypothetical protein [Bacteriovoracaceae bacterium]